MWTTEKGLGLPVFDDATVVVYRGSAGMGFGDGRLIDVTSTGDRARGGGCAAGGRIGGDEACIGGDAHGDVWWFHDITAGA